MKKIIGWGIGIVVLLMVAPAIGRQINSAQVEREKWECEHWIEQSEEIEVFFLADYQRSQCEALGFDVSSIKTPEEADQYYLGGQ